MSARELPRRDIHGARGRLAAPTRHVPANPEVLTLRDIPAVLKPGEQPQVTKPHFVPQPQQFAPQQVVVLPIPQQVAPTPLAVPLATDDLLARQRAALGFDDIPLLSAEDMENEKSLRDKASSWAKEAFHHGVSPEKRQRFTKFVKDKEFLAWKDDLKWALRADKDGAEGPQKPAEPVAQTPLNVVADPQQPRPMRVPQRGVPQRGGTQFAAGLRAQTQLRQHMPQAMTPAAAAGSKSIDINISFGSLPKLPDISKLKNKIPDVKPLLSDIRHLKWNRRTQITSAVAVVFLLFVAPHIFDNGGAKPASSTTANGVAVTSTKIEQKPDYQTVKPSGKSADDVKWARVSPPDHNPVFAYSDKIDNVVVNVSQQPVPDSFKADIDGSVATLAKSYNATEKIIAGNTPIYVGTAGGGPQSAIFTKNNLLILVKSTDKISESSWAKYAQSLN